MIERGQGPISGEHSGIDSKTFRRQRRWRNLAILSALVTFIVLVYLAFLVQMGGI